MYELIYCSRSKKDYSEAELLEMLTEFRASNEKNEVTGILVYNNREFTQLLEGRKNTIQRLYKNISDDPRHYNVNLFIEGPLPKRNFPDWSMGFVMSNETDEQIMGYTNIFERDLSEVITEDQLSTGTHLFKALCASLYFDHFGNSVR